MTLAATFEMIDAIELAFVFAIAFGIVAVCAVLFRRGQREGQSAGSE